VNVDGWMNAGVGGWVVVVGRAGGSGWCASVSILFCTVRFPAPIALYRSCFDHVVHSVRPCHVATIRQRKYQVRVQQVV
jgi:hypothetical protein